MTDSLRRSSILATLLKLLLVFSINTERGPQNADREIQFLWKTLYYA